MTVLICIKKGAWFNTITNAPFEHRAPNYGENVVVLKAHDLPRGRFYVLKGYDLPGANGLPAVFAARHFREVTDDKPEACDAEFLKSIKKCRQEEKM